MRVTRNHVYTAGTELPRGAKLSKAERIFQRSAAIDMASRPLQGRVTKAESVTERGEAFSKRVGKIVGDIPTPFLVKGSSKHGNR
jgi:hypothetical protein